MTADLERIPRRKTEMTPTVEKAIESLLGLSVPQIRDDISNRLVEGNLDFPIDLSLGFKKAKEQFKKEFLLKVLRFHNGNVAESARVAQLDRRAMHRLIKKFKISVEALRQQPYFFRDEKKDKYVRDVIAEVLENYDITRGRYEVDADTAQRISRELPEFRLSYDDALVLFEKEFIQKALQRYPSQKEAAEAVGLRYETLHKKAKEYALLSALV